MPNLNARWRQPPAPIDPAQITETLTADVVVVGCAHAGTAAARAAAEAGASVIAVDQQKEKLFHTVGNDLGHINSKFLAERGGLMWMRLNSLTIGSCEATTAPIPSW